MEFIEFYDVTGCFVTDLDKKPTLVRLAFNVANYSSRLKFLTYDVMVLLHPIITDRQP